MSREIIKDCVCDYCGKPLVRRNDPRSKHYFCGYDCRTAYHFAEHHKTRYCEICGKQMILPTNSTQRFCCKECVAKWQTTQIGENSPRYNSEIVICDWCGKEYFVKKSKVNNHRHFCCRKCKNEWYATVFTQTDEYKDQKTKLIINTMSSGKMPNTMTKPHVKVVECLNDLNEEYICEYPIEYYSIDIYLPSYGLMIEVMGDYWHCNPTTKYSNSNKSNQVKTIGRDKAKHTYVKNKYDVEILYLWEHDIINSDALCKALIQEYIAKHGVLTNYNSFNYNYNNELELKKEITVSPICT